MLALYVISILLFFILFVLATSIEFTLDAEARRREKESLLKGSFGVKWLFFSRTVSIEKPEKKGLPEESEKGRNGGLTEETEGLEKAKIEKREREREREKEEVLKTEEELREIEKERMEKLESKRKEEKVESKRKIKKLSRKRGEKKVEETKKSKKFWKKEYTYILRAFRCLREPLFRLFSDTLNAFKVRYLNADFTFGLPDPADTGMLCGFAHSLLGALHGKCSQCSVYINPVFLDPVLDIRGNTKISIKIYSLVFSFFKFILNRKTLCFTYSIIKEWLQGKLKAHSQAL